MTVDIQTSISVTKMIDKNSNPIQKSILHSVRNNQDIVDNLLIDMNQAFSSNVDEYFRYGTKFFEEGLPHSLITEPINGNNVSDAQLAIIQTNIETLVSEPVTITKAFITRVDYSFLGFEWLDKQPQSFWTNLGLDPIYKLSPTSLPKYSFSYDHNTGSMIIHIGLFSTMVNFNVGITGTDHTVITNIPFILPTEVFYHVKYVINSDYTNRIHYWNYQISTHVYPVLDLAVNTSVLANEYLPIAPIRKDKINVIDMLNNKIGLKTSTSKLLEKIGVNLDKLTGDMVDNSNPSSLDNVDEAFVMFGANIASTDQTVIRYMYEALREIKPFSIFNQQNAIDYIANGYTFSGQNNTIFLSSDSFSMNINYDFITIQIKTGLNILPKPSIDPYLPVPEIAGIDANNVGTGEVTVEFDQTHKSIIYRKQLTSIASGDSSNTYSELIVVNLQTVHNVLTDPQYYQVVTRDITNMSDGGFLFPLDYTLIKKFNVIKQTKIYEDSLYFLAYAFKITHLSFFQTGIFKLLVTIAIVIITIITNTEEFIGILTFETAALETLAKFIILSFILTKALEVVVKIIGGKLALILAVIAAIAATFPTSFKVLTKLINADDLMLFATSSTKAVNNVTADKFLQLQEDVNDFYKSLKDKQEELKKANDLLDSGNNYALYELKSEAMFTTFNEKPSEFFNRLIHHKNPGVLSLDMIQHYVDINLTLPTTTASI